MFQILNLTFSRPPKKSENNVAHVAVVRKQDDRQKLQGHGCKQCLEVTVDTIFLCYQFLVKLFDFQRTECLGVVKMMASCGYCSIVVKILMCKIKALAPTVLSFVSIQHHTVDL